MSHRVIRAGESRSFPDGHPLVEASGDPGDILIFIGVNAGSRFSEFGDTSGYRAVLIELGTECLGVHAGEVRGEEGGIVLGFARFRLGDGPPSDLVEIVRQPASHDQAINAARELFESYRLRTAVCNDFPGRIVDRLIRPFYNDVLNRLDAKLGSASDMDLTLKLGLGYPEGPIELLERTGLAAHCDVSLALYNWLNDPAYAPARRARVAKARQLRSV